jgi:hypothetical protein
LVDESFRISVECCGGSSKLIGYLRFDELNEAILEVNPMVLKIGYLKPIKHQCLSNPNNKLFPTLILSIDQLADMKMRSSLINIGFQRIRRTF